MNFRSNKWINMAPRKEAKNVDELANYEIAQPEGNANNGASNNNETLWNNVAAVSVWLLFFVIAFLFYTPFEETTLHCYYYMMLFALVLGAVSITKDYYKLAVVALMISAHPFISSWLRREH
uniref:Transmembrane protein n=1 Tax=Panagrellus redivivus TaxID=6233 RepID=A0A7E4ZU70_PANRE